MYQLGDLVWAKLGRHPWWPSLVTLSPDNMQYSKKIKKDTQYHVQFLSEKPTHAWVKLKCLAQYQGSDVPECKVGGMYYSKKKTFMTALASAEQAQSMDIETRFKVFCHADKFWQEKKGSVKKKRKSPQGTQDSYGFPAAKKFKPGPRCKMRERLERLRFQVDKTPVPETWLTTFVLMNTCDIPETLTPKGYVILASDDPKQTALCTTSNNPPTLAAVRNIKVETSDVVMESGPSDSDKGALSTPAMMTANNIQSTTDPLKNIKVETSDTVIESGQSDGEKGAPLTSALCTTSNNPPTPAPMRNIKVETSDIVMESGPSDSDKGALPTPVSCTARNKKPTPARVRNKMGKTPDIVTETDPLDSETPAAQDAGDDASDRDILTDDSDGDPQWCPVGQKKVFETKKKRGYKLASKEAAKRTPFRKSARTSSKAPSTRSASTSHTPSSATKTNILAKRSSNQQPSNVINIVNSETSNSSAPRPDDPTVDDFVVEKDVVLSGDIDFIWRVQRGGLVQKYEKITLQDDSVGYRNMANYADWSAKSRNRYVKIECMIVYMQKKTKEEVFKIVKLPSKDSILVSEICQSKTPVPPTKSVGRRSKSPVCTSPGPSRGRPRTQEQEVSSTTSDLDFENGNFVIDNKDLRNVDNFCIWKIESTILLMKYEPVSIRGQMMHKPVKTYRGYRDIGKFYTPVKVRQHPDGNVEVTEDTKPKLFVNESMEEEYDRNPLLRHFYVYLQVILSQALEPEFIDNINRTKNPTYILPIGEVEKIIKQKCTNIERKVRWTSNIKSALKTMPYLREVPKKEENKLCEGSLEGRDQVEESVFLFGPRYDPDNLKQQDNDMTVGKNLEFKIGKTCINHIQPYHQLCHFKFSLFGRCKSKIKLIKDARSTEPDVKEIMDECLGNKYWVLQAFEDFIKLVELPYH